MVAIEELMESVHQGDMLIVDGNAGGVHVNPNPEVIREYDRLERDYAELNRELERTERSPGGNHRRPSSVALRQHRPA